MSTGEIIIALINAGALGYVIFYLQKMHRKQIELLKEQNQTLREKNSMLEVLSSSRMYQDLKAKTEYYESKIKEMEEKGQAKEEQLKAKLEKSLRQKKNLVEFMKVKYGLDLTVIDSVKKRDDIAVWSHLVEQMKLGELLAALRQSTYHTDLDEFEPSLLDFIGEETAKDNSKKPKQSPKSDKNEGGEIEK